MPRLVNRPPAYGLHRGSGQARIKVNGKTTYLGKYGSPESKAKYAEIVASLAQPQLDDATTFVEPVPGKSLLVGQIIARFTAHARTYYAASRELANITWALRPVAERFGELPCDQFGPRKLREVRDLMVERGGSRYGANKVAAMTKRAFNWAASEELCSPTIPMALKTLAAIRQGRTKARENEPVGPVDDARIDATLPFLTAPMADMIRLLRLTGARPGEIVNARVEDLDRTDPACWWLKPKTHKNAYRGQGRAIPLGARAQEVLLPYVVKAGKSGRLFAVCRVALSQAVNRACVKAGVEPWTPRQIRHSVATEVRRAMGLEFSQAVLGHSRVDTTQHYAAMSADLGLEFAKRFG